MLDAEDRSLGGVGSGLAPWMPNIGALCGCSGLGRLVVENEGLHLAACPWVENKQRRRWVEWGKVGLENSGRRGETRVHQSVPYTDALFG